MADIKYYDVILRPVITEKSMGLTGEKKYTFYVNPLANKSQIKEAVEKMFAGTYGIIVEDIPIESVRLKVDAYQANYLRSLPLHPSQHELKRTDEYAIFSLRVRPTYDFRQKLLSFGSTIEVLQPESLREEMREEIATMLKRYQDD